VRRSDVVYSNLRGDQPRRLRLTYADLAHLNKRIVCCSLSGFGMTGPRASQGGYDYIMQGLAGWMSLTGEPDGPPTKSGLSLVDYSGGYVSTIAVLAGLWRARRDGVGCDCDISLFETALAELCYVGTWAASEAYEPPRRRNSAHPSIVPFQNFQTADGWLVIACPKPKFWQRLCQAIGHPELAADPRFEDFEGRDRNREALLAILDRAFSDRTTAVWLELLVEAGVPCAPVNDVPAAFRDPQVEARNAMVEYQHPHFGSVRQAASPLRVGSEPRPVERAPARGEHTTAILMEVCGYTEEKVADLVSLGAIALPSSDP
jgi:crotonobetainyl-CoA:carnitine CoA-transferase CaiB-like acyl-CoA transferase